MTESVAAGGPETGTGGGSSRQGSILNAGLVKNEGGTLHGWINVATGVGTFARIEIDNKIIARVGPTVPQLEVPEGRHFHYDVSSFESRPAILNVYLGDSYLILNGCPIILGPSEPVTGENAMEREQVGDMIAVSEARTDAKFARLDGKLDLLAERIGALATDNRNMLTESRSNRNLIVGTVIASSLGIGALLLGVMTYGDAIFSRGMSVRDVVKSVVIEHEQSRAGRDTAK